MQAGSSDGSPGRTISVQAPATVSNMIGKSKVVGLISESGSSGRVPPGRSPRSRSSIPSERGFWDATATPSGKGRRSAIASIYTLCTSYYCGFWAFVAETLHPSELYSASLQLGAK